MTAAAARLATDRRRLRSLLAGAGIALLLAVATLLAHGWSLADGAVLDDHWHQQGLRAHGWSPGDLLRTLEIEPARWVHFWWQEQSVRWEYFRPLFTLAMKILYVTIGQHDPLPLHAFSITLHWLSAGMVFLLGRWIGLRALWAGAAALLFVLYPHATITVAWSSSLNVVMVTCLMLGALLAYWRASGLTASRARATEDTPRLRGGWTIAALLLWVLALLSRENALMLLPMCVACDAVYGGRGHLRRRIGVYAAGGVLAVAFVLLRIALIDHPMPNVYVRLPGGDLVEYAAWASAKLLHYLVSSIWFAPMSVGPTGRFNPFLEAPLDCLLMVALLVVLGGGYFWATRRRPGWWLWPLWILLAVLPVVPVIATPHSGYLPGVGLALAIGLVGDAARWRGWRAAALCRGVVAVYLVGAGIFTMFNRWQWTAIIAAEQLVLEWVATRPPPAEAEHVFFINLPFVNIYAKPALDQRLGPEFEDLACHVLTFSPDAFLFEQRSRVTPVDEHSFVLEVEGRPYFAGVLGRFLLDGFGRGGALRAGDVFHSNEFDAEVLRADAHGVEALRFTFHRPLADLAYCFYFTSAECGAARLKFVEIEGQAAEPLESSLAVTEVQTLAERFSAGDARAGAALLQIAASADHPRRAEAVALLRPVAEFVAGATGGPSLPSEQDPQAWGEFADWWRTHVTDETLRDTWLLRADFAAYLKAREEVPHARMWVGKVIRTDLYLTGPPFPGPRPRETP